MELIKELTELKDTIANEIAQANKEIKKAGGDLNSGDIEMIDKLTHSMKSLVTTCAMLEAEDDGGYSERYMMPYYSRDDGYTRRNSYGRDGRNGSGNYGSYARNESRYSRNGYSRGVDWNEHLRMMMDEAPDEQTRMDIKRIMDRTQN
ncbi:MAG: hypothetical protein IIY60_01045 [Clostridia bacterium]|nr:hypothetical protein [Clostridia bacterium]